MKKKHVLIANLLLFIFIYIYFTQVSPLFPFDGDDWRYIGGIRPPFPMWGVWNPTRVLPETLMGVGGYIAAFVFYPISHNYVNSLMYVEAFIFSVFIEAFLISYYKLLTKRFKISKSLSIISELLFFISFFLLFKHMNQPSYSGFWTVDLACEFFYLIPGILNAAVVMYMEQSPNFFDHFMKLSNFIKGLFILILYFTLFSNTQLTIIIAAYSSFKIIQALVDIKWKVNIQYFKTISIYLVILVVWLGTILFDLNGQRSKDVQAMHSSSFSTSFLETVKQVKQFLSIQNTKFLYLFIATIIFAFVYWLCVKSIKHQSSIFIGTIINGIFCSICSMLYLILAYSKAGSQYAVRPDAMWAVIFFFLFTVNICFIYLVINIDIVKPILPLMVVILSLVAFNFNYHQVPATNAPYDAITASNVDNYIISQVKKADEKGKDEAIVKVPLDSKDANPKLSTSNWPHSYDMAIWLQNTLYSHGIIRSRMHIVFKPDRAVTNRFYESKNQQPFVPLE